MPINKKRKLRPKTVDCIFISYAFHNIGYKFLIIKYGVPDMHVGTIMDSRDAIFFEDIFPMREDYCRTSQKSIINDEPTEMIEHNEQTLVENLWGDNETFKRSKGQRTAKSFGDDFIVFLVDDTPRTIEEAYSSLDADYWKEAIKSELDSIMSNGTWEVVSRPYGCKPLGCKWVFKKKLRSDGTIEKYKARLVAKGYNQKEGEYIFHTYSPVARLTTIRVLLSLATYMVFSFIGWTLRQLFEMESWRKRSIWINQMILQ
jgi:hypothetical protein